MAIGLNDITLDEINIMIEVELSRQIKMNNPEKNRQVQQQVNCEYLEK